MYGLEDRALRTGMLLLLLTPAAFAGPVVASAQLERQHVEYPGTINFTLDFGQSFNSIDSVLVTMVLSHEDGIDPGEVAWIHFQESPFGAFGQAGRPGETIFESVFLLVMPGHEYFINPLLDGHAPGWLSIEPDFFTTGGPALPSVTFESLTFAVYPAAAVPEPSGSAYLGLAALAAWRGIKKRYLRFRGRALV